MHKSRLGVLVIDCKAGDLEPHARFWAEALGYGFDQVDEDGKYAVLEGPEGEPRVLLQAVDHDPRVHLDIETDDTEAEVRRLEALGAKALGPVKNWVVMEAPSGHRFCIVGPQRAGFETGARAWEE